LAGRYLAQQIWSLNPSLHIIDKLVTPQVNMIFQMFPWERLVPPFCHESLIAGYC